MHLLHVPLLPYHLCMPSYQTQRPLLLLPQHRQWQWQRQGHTVLDTHTAATAGASQQEAVPWLEAGSAPGAIALPVGLALRVGRPALLLLPGRRGRPTLERTLPVASIVLRRRLQKPHALRVCSWEIIPASGSGMEGLSKMCIAVMPVAWPATV
jgi:hypothetical protein